MKHPIQNAGTRRLLRPFVRFIPQGKWGVRLYGPRRYVGHQWESRGKLQRDFLIAEGLRPHHQLLDFGCGCLRGGLPIAQYLEPLHYVGVEPQPLLRKEARHLAGRHLPHKKVRILCPDALVSSEFRPDIVWVHSVFTHLVAQDIRKVLRTLVPFCGPHTEVYATYFAGPLSHTNPRHSHDQWAFFYTQPELESIAGPGWQSQFLNHYPHPRGQALWHLQRTET